MEGTVIMKYIHIFMIHLVLTACLPAASPSPNRTTNTHSTQFSTQSEKSAFLDEYLILHSPVQATEFYIIYQDNSSGRGVPGPSDWSITAAIKIDPADVPLWTADRTPIDPATVDLTRSSNILPTTPEWAVTSTSVA